MRFFYLCALILACFALPVHAQDTTQQDSQLPSRTSVPETGGVSESLSRALNRLRSDQTFQLLRDERIRLLESIPQTRASIQAQQAELARLNTEISSLEVRLKAAKSSVESETVANLRAELLSVEGFQKSLVSRASILATERQSKESALAEAKVKLDGLESELKNIEQSIADARQTEQQAEASFRVITSQIEAKRFKAKGLIEILEEEFKLTDNPDLLDDLATARRDLLNIEQERFSAEVNSAEIEIRAAERAVSDLLELADLRRAALREAQERASILESELGDLREREQRTASDQFDVGADIEKLNAAVSRQLKLDEESSDSPTSIENLLAALVQERNAAAEMLVTASKKLETDILRQTTVENEINDLFIPRQAENSFKLLMSFAFAILVGLVIWKFFGITREDEKVRRVVFSAEAGIQFVTLFSLVIAIILFGITGILEGKELSALLGGISGYILGRATPVAAVDAPGSESVFAGRRSYQPDSDDVFVGPEIGENRYGRRVDLDDDHSPALDRD